MPLRQIRHDVENFLMMSKICHDVKRFVMTSKARHDVKKFVITSKTFVLMAKRLENNGSATLKSSRIDVWTHARTHMAQLIMNTLHVCCGFRIYIYTYIFIYYVFLMS